MQAFFEQDIRNRLIDYSTEVEHLTSPQEVLNRLHDITAEKLVFVF